MSAWQPPVAEREGLDGAVDTLIAETTIPQP